jgi:hypothetical protein
MANQLDNLTEETFGFLSVVERAPNDTFGNVWWRCRCVCGEEKLVRAGQLRTGKFFYCGKEVCRFWSKVYRPQEGCWIWTASKKSSGYGAFKAKRTMPAHHYSWIMKNGPVPEGLFILHSCDNKLCVRPDHLFLGTHQDNMDDMVSKGRQSRDKGLKITKEFAEQLRLEYADGSVSQPVLAQKYGLSLPLVENVLQHRTWVN